MTESKHRDVAFGTVALFDIILSSSFETPSVSEHRVLVLVPPAVMLAPPRILIADDQLDVLEAPRLLLKRFRAGSRGEPRRCGIARWQFASGGAVLASSIGAARRNPR